MKKISDATSTTDIQHRAVDNDHAKSSGHFATTHWSVVLLAGREVSPESAAALEKLCRAYWRPVYAFARHKGWGEEDAKDLTQQFFARLLERHDFCGLDPKRGKFRTFLLTAFTHFLSNERDYAKALKRGGGKVISLEEIRLDEIPSNAELSATTLYDLRWARTILQSALEQLKAEMFKANKQPQFDLLRPFLTDSGGSGQYAIAAEKLGLEAASVPVLVHRLRQRYRELVRQEVAQTVASPTDLEEEMRHLFAVLNQ
jgi:RNA polymerase sigma-70 factor (ECF subfamily)